MNLKQVKSVQEIQLTGVEIELVLINDGVRGVILRDSQGHKLHIQKKDSYSQDLDVLVPAPPKQQELFCLFGLVGGLAINQIYDTEEEALTAKREAEALGVNTKELSVKAIQVPGEPADVSA